MSGARASRPQFDQALDALIGGGTLVIATLDGLRRFTQNMLSSALQKAANTAGIHTQSY
ncbi:hypothetical protein [Arthrobacter sp. RT-1]|uniref:hypothetical protein n=1 Tax=Arthrobacter sp. RT-1 TaxID=2292263 RepID=UPI0037C03489